MWGPGIFLENKQHTGGTVGNPQDYAAKTWAGLYGTFYQARQQLLIDMLGDAVDVVSHTMRFQLIRKDKLSLARIIRESQ